MNSLYRLLKVLDFIEVRGAVVSVEQMSAELGYTRSTLYRYLKVLADAGLLSVWNGGGYSLGPRVFELHARAHATDPFLTGGCAGLEALVRSHRGFGFICRRHKHRLLVVHADHGGGEAQTRFAAGNSCAMTTAAPGRVILAHLPSIQLRRIAKASPDGQGDAAGLATIEALRERFRHIRERGFDVDRNFEGSTLTLVSVPVTDAQANAIGSLTLGVDSARLTDQKTDIVVARLGEVAQQITARLGPGDPG